MEQQKIHEDTWKKKSHSAFEGKAGGMMPFYESLCTLSLAFFIYWVTSIDNADLLPNFFMEIIDIYTVYYSDSQK